MNPPSTSKFLHSVLGEGEHLELIRMQSKKASGCPAVPETVQHLLYAML